MCPVSWSVLVITDTSVSVFLHVVFAFGSVHSSQVACERVIRAVPAAIVSFEARISLTRPFVVINIPNALLAKNRQLFYSAVDFVGTISA